MFATLAESPLVERFGWALVHTTWQFALVCLVAVTVQSVIGTRSSTARYGVGLLAMGILAVCPAVTFVWVSRTMPDALEQGAVLTTRSGRLAPQRIRIKVQNKLIHHWSFAVYEPGLWLLDQARDGKDNLAASVDEVHVNGKPVSAKHRLR